MDTSEGGLKTRATRGTRISLANRAAELQAGADALEAGRLFGRRGDNPPQVNNLPHTSR
jgi:hypothetical protein